MQLYNSLLTWLKAASQVGTTRNFLTFTQNDRVTGVGKSAPAALLAWDMERVGVVLVQVKLVAPRLVEVVAIMCEETSGRGKCVEKRVYAGWER